MSAHDDAHRVQETYATYKAAASEYRRWLSTDREDEIDAAEARMESAMDEYMEARKRYFAHA